jgi:hypothetical protein
MQLVLSVVKEEVVRFHEDHREFFADSPPTLRAVSPLAEGSDRHFAEQALDLGYALCCPMPFPQAEFEKDFEGSRALEPDSRNRFRRLLARAVAEASLTTFELDGARTNEASAYGAAGQIVLNQSDLLVVVWDGEHQGKPGGTEETFAEARRRGVPIVWIDACAPHPWRVLDASMPLPAGRAATGDPDPLAHLKKQVRETLDLPPPPPRSADQVAPRVALEDFFRETKPRTNRAVLWKCFRDVVGDGRWPKPDWKVEDFEEAVLGEWPRDESTAAARLVDRLRPFYAWPDKLAVRYSDTYRSAFILVFLFAAAAVGFALFPWAAGWVDVADHWMEALFIIAELVVIVAILGLVRRGHRRRWHERWIDYRLVAELVRHMRLVISLGGGRSFPTPPPFLASYGRPGATWMAWYVRAVERDLGLMSATMNSAHLLEFLDHLLELVLGQRQWHHTNAERCDRIEKRLHLTGLVLLWATVLAVGLHLLFALAPALAPPWLPRALTFLCGFLPALGAALYGITNQGEFRRIEKRSRAMGEHLKDLHERARDLKQDLERGQAQDGLPSRRVVALATDVAQLMAGEVLDWRVVFLDRPLTQPH